MRLQVSFGQHVHSLCCYTSSSSSSPRLLRPVLHQDRASTITRLSISGSNQGSHHREVVGCAASVLLLPALLRLLLLLSLSLAFAFVPASRSLPPETDIHSDLPVGYCEQADEMIAPSSPSLLLLPRFMMPLFDR